MICGTLMDIEFFSLKVEADPLNKASTPRLFMGG